MSWIWVANGVSACIQKRQRLLPPSGGEHGGRGGGGWVGVDGGGGIREAGGRGHGRQVVRAGLLVGIGQRDRRAQQHLTIRARLLDRAVRDLEQRCIRGRVGLRLPEAEADVR